MAKTVPYRKDASLPVLVLNYTIANYQDQCGFPFNEHFIDQNQFQLLNGTKGRIRIYPRGHSNEDKNWLTLYTSLESKIDAVTYMNLAVHILTMNEEQVAFSNEFQLMFSPGSMWNIVKVAPIETILDPTHGMLLPDGGLKVRLFLGTSVHKVAPCRLPCADQQTWKKVKNVLQEEIGQRGCDLAFMVGKCFFLVHKEVIVYSSTFRAILKEQSNLNKRFIQLPYVRPESFEKLLIDCYIKSNRFCKKCLSYRKSKGAVCCEIISTWRGV